MTEVQECNLCHNRFNHTQMIGQDAGGFLCITCVMRKKEDPDYINKMKFTGVQIGSPKECERFLTNMVSESSISNAAFRLAYFVIYEQQWNVMTLESCASHFNWDVNLTQDIIEELEELNIVKILE